MRACLAMKVASIHREVTVSFGLVRRVNSDHWRPAGIPDDVCQKLSQNPCAACRLGSHKADALTLCLRFKKKEQILLRTDYGRPASIPDDICQELSQNPRAVCRLGSHKADAMTLCLPSKKKEEILLRTDYWRPAAPPNNVR